MRSGTCPFISPFMDKRIFLPKESTRHSSLDKNTMKNNNNLVQSRSQFCQIRAMNVMVCKWDGQRKGTLHLSYLIKSKHLKGRLGPRVSDDFWTKGGRLGPCVSDVFCTKGGWLGPRVSDIFCTKGGRSGPCQ